MGEVPIAEALGARDIGGHEEEREKRSTRRQGPIEAGPSSRVAHG